MKNSIQFKSKGIKFPQKMEWDDRECRIEGRLKGSPEVQKIKNREV